MKKEMVNIGGTKYTGIKVSKEQISGLIEEFKKQGFKVRLDPAHAGGIAGPPVPHYVVSGSLEPYFPQLGPAGLPLNVKGAPKLKAHIFWE